jgi:methanogenic corrinoid protein MtbC1
MTVKKTLTDRPSAAGHGCAQMHPLLSGFAETALARLCAETRPGEGGGTARSVLGDPCAAAMAYALCDEDDGAASLLVDDLLDAGVSVGDVCLDHLAPAARRLGDLWDRDKLPFTDVALASARIQAILRRLPADRGGPRVHHARGAVFGAVPGEQHTLGVMMAADLFRRSGWDVGLMVGLTHDEMIARISRDDRRVIGLSCSGDHSYPALRRLLAAVAKARPDAELLLAGQIVQTPDRIADLPARVVPVPDMATAEVEMARIEVTLTAPSRRQAHRRPSTAA